MNVTGAVRWIVFGVILSAAIIGGVYYVGVQQSGVGANGEPSDEQVRDAEEVMLALPDFEETEGSAESILSDMRSALEDEFGPIEWKHDPFGKRDIGGCSVAEMTGGDAFSQEARSRWFGDLDAAQSSRAVDIVVARALSYGYAQNAGEIVDPHGGRHIELYTERDGFVSITATGTLGISVVSDCFLTAEGKDRVRGER